MVSQEKFLGMKWNLIGVISITSLTLAAVNPSSSSITVCICFDVSRAQGEAPDRHINNLAGVIINKRNGRVAVKGDARKM